MEVENGEQRDGEDDMQGEEETVRVLSNSRQRSSPDDQKNGDRAQSENDVAVPDAFEQQRLEDIEVHVHGGVDEEERDQDAAEEAVVGV